MILSTIVNTCIFSKKKAIHSVSSLVCRHCRKDFVYCWVSESLERPCPKAFLSCADCYSGGLRALGACWGEETKVKSRLGALYSHFYFWVELNAGTLVLRCMVSRYWGRPRHIIGFELWPRYLCHFSSCQFHNRHSNGVGISHRDGALPLSDQIQRKEPSLI